VVKVKAKQIASTGKASKNAKAVVFMRPSFQRGYWISRFGASHGFLQATVASAKTADGMCGKGVQ